MSENNFAASLQQLFFSIVLSPGQAFLFPYGYIPVTSYHNPTVWLAKLFSLGSMLLTIRYVNEPKISLKILFFAGVINICSVLSKPNYAMCFLPALAVFICVELFHKSKINWNFVLYSTGIPMILTLTWQYWLRYLVEPAAQLTVAPLVVAENLSKQGPLFIELILGCLFPLVVFLLYFKDIRHNKWLVFGWGQFVIALFVLLVMSAFYWLKRISNPKWKKADWIPFVVLMIHGFFGLGYWYSCLLIL